MNHQENPNSGLLRFRSVPSSLFSNFTIEKNRDLIENREQTRFDSKIFIQEFEEQKPSLDEFSSKSYWPPQYPKQSSCSVMSSNLMRQSSSPAGLLSRFTSQDGYGTLRGVGNYRLGTLPRISEIGNENISKNCTTNTKLGNRYAFGSRSDSSNFPDNFSVYRNGLENDGKLFPSSQNGEIGIREHCSSRHSSLPNTSAEFAATDRFLRFQDTVPCKVRAKRGCATHPRSIAERVRRTRISEKMRKLQDVVPNIDKQTNTAEMLDLAVEYIKELQTQFKILNEIRGKCKCSSMQKSLRNL